MRLTRTVAAWVMGAALALSALTPVHAAPTGAGVEQATGLVAASPDAAVQAAVEATGDEYAGDCAQTVSPRDIGKVCSRLVAERDGARAYLIGRTFSEFSHWVFIAPAGADAWRVTAVTPLDFFGPPDPPWP